MMENLTPKERDLVKAGSVMAAVLLAAVLYYNFSIVQPQLKKDEKKVVELKDVIKKSQEEIADLNKLASDTAELERKKDALLKISAKLPDSIDAPGFYQALIDILQATRVEYSSLIQGREETREHYVEIPYRIGCRARYHDFGQFMNFIEENSRRFMRVKTFSVSNQDNRPSIHPANIEMATFMFTKR